MYYYQDRRDEENRLTALYISPKASVNLLLQFSYVIFMDITYKTNKFNLPLFNICGVTSTRQSFQVGAIFLSSEAQGHYN